MPGLGNADIEGQSGCYATLMSPYSSWFREAIWGGIPIALPALSLYAFIAFWSLMLLLSSERRQRDLTLLLAAGGVTLAASVIYAYWAVVSLSSFCQVCAGMYLASALCFGGALVARKSAASDRAFEDEVSEGQSVRGTWHPSLGAVAAVALAALLLPLGAYAVAAPDHGPLITECGSLGREPKPRDGALPLAGTSLVSALEVFDPLCEACAAFEGRLQDSGVAERLQRKLLLFPMDSECNWMIDTSLHPGACAASEAIVCAQDLTLRERVIAWELEQQQELLQLATTGTGKAVRERIGRAFPSLAPCLGSAKAKAQLNRGLRWAIREELPVLTPQLYIKRRRLCEADTDLGLEYAVSHLLTRPPPGAP